MLADETLSDGRTVKSTIGSILCETMPTAAIAAGLVSKVPTRPTLDRLWASYGVELVHAPLGLTGLCRWLEAKGERLGLAIVEEFLDELVAEEVRLTTGGVARHLAPTPGVYFHATPK